MTTPKAHDGAPRRNSYGRRHGKTLRKSQVVHMQTTLKEISPKNVTYEDNPNRDPIAVTDLFGDDRPVWLEIGFGGGEHLLHMAQTYPEVGIIGCEPYVNGVAMLVPRIAETGVTNVRVHMGDARDLLDVLPEASLDKAFLLYPDPWPKSRHRQRRFIEPENIDQLARALKPGAEFRVATDIEDYARQTQQHMLGRDDFDVLTTTDDALKKPWADWHRTRYEAKAIRENRTPNYMTFRRR
ncbi:MAG: tRNA (guanosine(46)-N7)-methyltransferase TrmB [Rhodobacteraceae bacterium]|nr:tRNA (guanosine(46)-N7)-methyltransferase TrmB [Paracoccaceae bacterium]